MRKLIIKTGLIALILASPLLAAADETPGVFKIPGTNSTIAFNGFAEAALFYQFYGGTPFLAHPSCDIYWCAPSIALNNAGYFGNPQAGMVVAYSRFGVNTLTPSDVGTIHVRFEVDAASGSASNYDRTGGGDTHSNYIRIRHAYGEVGDWFLMGQTWSNFADLNTFPDQMDENPFGNLAALRSPMIRFTIPAGAAAISIALEDPYYTSLSSSIWNVPDLTAKVAFNAGPASISIRGMAKQYKNENGAAAGFGFAAGLALKLGDDLLTVDGAGGPGIGTYLYGSTLGAVAQDVAQNPLTGSIDTWTVFGASADYTHTWSAKARTNIMAYGEWAASSTNIQNDLGTATYNQANKAVYSVGLNTYWSPYKSFWVGPEFYYNYRQNFGGQNGSEVRGELVSHFNFF